MTTNSGKSTSRNGACRGTPHVADANPRRRQSSHERSASRRRSARYDYSIEQPKSAWTREELNKHIMRLQGELHARAIAGDFAPDKLEDLRRARDGGGGAGEGEARAAVAARSGEDA